MRVVLTSAALTGGFCALFAVGVDLLTDMLGRGQLLGVSFTSGFLGSIFAQTVLAKWRDKG